MLKPSVSGEFKYHMGKAFDQRLQFGDLLRCEALHLFPPIIRQPTDRGLKAEIDGLLYGNFDLLCVVFHDAFGMNDLRPVRQRHKRIKHG